MRPIFKNRDNLSVLHLTWIQALVSRVLLLALPVLLTVILLTASVYTYGVSLLLIYFVLPMFYAVDKRTRYSVNGIGKAKFSYADGYKAFFKENQGNFFGLLKTLLLVGLALVLCALVFSSTLPSLMNLYPQASFYYDGFMNLLDSHASGKELYAYLVQNGQTLVQPMTLYVGIVLFLPEVIFFLLENENLSQHYLASLLLPDIDTNVSPSQARALASKAIGKKYSWYRYRMGLLRCWPGLVSYVLVYIGSLWACSYLVVDNFYLMPLVFFLAPLSSLAFGFFLNIVTMRSNYQVIEKSQSLLLDSLSLKVRESVKEAYQAPSYHHGEESLVRGCFIAETNKPVKPEETSFGVVVDLSHKEERT